jgi:large subunit ribosomal protein L33
LGTWIGWWRPLGGFPVAFANFSTPTPPNRFFSIDGPGRAALVAMTMPREHVIIECTEARAEGKPVSRYMTTRNKKLQPEKVEKKKFNPFLRRHTLHREIKG